MNTASAATFVLWPDDALCGNTSCDATQDAKTVSRLGGKASALAVAERAGLMVPAWFVVSPPAFEASLAASGNAALWATMDTAQRCGALENLQLDDAVRLSLRDALARLCPDGERVAVRSSAIDEDGAQHSFAGQWDSFLNILPNEEAVSERLAAVWRSGFSERALAYRRERALPLLPQPPAILVQRMVSAQAAGVAFSADPVAARRGVCVVAAVPGLGSALVGGECDADTFHVDGDGQIIRREVARKSFAHRCDVSGASGVVSAPLAPSEQNEAALDDAQIRAVAELARAAERCFGQAQDIEWAIEDDLLYLLQSRPITTLGSLPVSSPADRPAAHIALADGALNLWDNSNIAESYNGVTTPLTFSFARRAYEEVYRRFCRLMGVPARQLAAHDATFGQMLGLVRGRIYYNLLNWYRLLALLPGFQLNRGFMEQMMGVREPLPDAVLGLTPATRGERLGDALRLARTLTGLVWNHWMLPRRVAQFYARLDATLAAPTPSLEAMRADQLAAHYRDLERQLLKQWDAPLVNDFFAMIFHGVSRRLAEKWCGDRDGSLQNALLRDVSGTDVSGTPEMSGAANVTTAHNTANGRGTGMISAEPARRVRAMARLAAEQPALVAALCENAPDAARNAMKNTPQFQAMYDEYLADFGERCLEELKLESPTLHDDATPLLRAVGNLARQMTASQAAAKIETEVGAYETPGASARATAEAQVSAALACHALRRVVFGWTMRHARARVRDREHLRFERTRVFGRARRIFVEIGRRLHALDRLDDARDVFYLEVDEVLGFIEGTATTTDLKGLVALRRREFDGYRADAAPADRFQTRGIVYVGNAFRDASQESAARKNGTAETATGAVQNEQNDPVQRSGIGCCQGVVRGPVRVVIDPRGVALQAGEILVAERTDPGWIMLFPAVAGLLVERGSLLSHSAIVARELGLPAIVALPGVTRWLRDGDLVEMDGGSGIVRRINDLQD